MSKGEYLTKPQFPGAQDRIEAAAAEWLEAHSGETGEAIMRSLADLIKRECSMSNQASASGAKDDPAAPVATNKF